MGSKIKVELHADTHNLIVWALDALRKPDGIPSGLEVEGLVLLDFHQRNLVRLTMEKPPFKINLKPHEAISLRRLLYGIDLEDPLADISRNNLCCEVMKQLPINFQ